MKTAGLVLLIFAVLSVGTERCVSLFAERRALKGALSLIRYLKASLSDHAEVLPSVYAGFGGGVSPSFDRDLRENGLSEAVKKNARLFRSDTRETMEGLAAGIGTGSRETRLSLLTDAEKRMAETLKKNDVSFPGEVRVTAAWTFGAVGFLLIRFL